MLQVFGTPLFVTCIVFSIAVSKTVVNYDGKGGTAPDPLIWSSVALIKKKPKVIPLLEIWPGPAPLWTGRWQGWPHIIIYLDDVGGWPYSVGLLNKFLELGGASFWRCSFCTKLGR